MKIFEINISNNLFDYLKQNLINDADFICFNNKIFNDFGLVNFCENINDYFILKKEITTQHTFLNERSQIEYGDFQTNLELANKVTSYLFDKNINPEIIIEPTCGKGNFIIASLEIFKDVKKIIGIEIYKPYVWEAKFRIMEFYLCHEAVNKPEILIIHDNIFDINIKDMLGNNITQRTLVVGNPPWVNNSKLSKLSSDNIPLKKNFKNKKGLDAITGKSNFDIAEFITLKMIQIFEKSESYLALLLKNSVIKNIVIEQKRNNYALSSIEKHSIDSKKEFDVSVEASLFYCKLNSLSSYKCKEFNFYNNNKIENNEFGWFGNKFVSNLHQYLENQDIDGDSPFVWRQGLKHDCSSIMELEKVENYYTNALKEKINLEADLVFGFIKSSDLKKIVVKTSRKYTIVTQKKTGQDTDYIRYNYPLTYFYLQKHQELFNERKSSIYKNKPPFSIFGIGEYSFQKYKVAISGLYKTFHFSLILPENEKPVMLDDTCYMLGFNKLEYAVYTLLLLNSPQTIKLLQSITFLDAKRVFTKDILMRIDLFKIAQLVDKNSISQELKLFNSENNFNITLDLWSDFICQMKATKNLNQTILF